MKASAKFVPLLMIAVAVGLSSPLEAQPAAKPTPELVERYVKNTWKAPPDGWQARIDQDETQRICSEYRNSPPSELAQKLMAKEAATVVFPADGVVLGKWKDGEKVAQTGSGGQFSDPPNAVKGGNCYACHQMAAKELSFGTIGPSLLEYGKLRDYKADEARRTYAKIFNAQSVQACSNMPRFGYHKFLTEQQLKDVTAYLFDPESPVNKP